MSFTVTDAFVNQYTGNINMLAQQMDSRLRGAVHEVPITGESLFIEQVAASTARKRQSRHEDSPIMNTQHLRRRVSPYDYEWGDLVDKLDQVRMLIDPTSTYAQTAASAMMRAVDDEIIAGFFAVAYTGHAGGTSVTWPNGNAESTPTAPAGTQVAVNSWTYGNGSGNAGLTISKLIEASVALDVAEGDDGEERFIAIQGRQKGQLLATTEATSADYNTVQALVQGKIDTFMGFKFLHTERLLTDGSGYYRVPVWRRTGIGLGVAQDIQGKVSERADKGFAYYVYCSMACGAARLEEAKVVEIKCT
jgi:hypothetical protein